MSASTWISVAAVAGAAAVLRVLVDRAVAARTGRAFPWGTLVVNLSGAAALGLVTGLELPRHAALVAGTAAVGSYTTFSTWMAESRSLARSGRRGRRSLNLVVSLGLGLMAVYVGREAGRALA